MAKEIVQNIEIRLQTVGLPISQFGIHIEATNVMHCQLLLIMNFSPFQILRSKSKQTGEGENINGKVNPISGPVHSVVAIGEVERSMELGYDLRVPIISKAHKFFYIIPLTCLHHSVTNSIIQVGDVIPINGLHWSNRCLLGSEDH